MNNEVSATSVENFSMQCELLKTLIQIGITPVVCGEFGRTRFILQCFPEVQFKIIDAREIDELKTLVRSYQLVDGVLQEGPGLITGEWIIVRNIDHNLSIIPMLRQYKSKFLLTARKNIAIKSCKYVHLTYSKMLVDLSFADDQVCAFVSNMLGVIDNRYRFRMLQRLHKRLHNVSGMTLENRLRVYYAIKVVCLSNEEKREREKKEITLRSALCLSEQAIWQYEDTLFNYAGSAKHSETSFEINNFYLVKSMKDVYNVLMDCIVHKEHVLLVGETGTGKTSLVEYVVKNVHGRNLKVINLSSDTEISDLVGSYQVLKNECRDKNCEAVRFNFKESAFSRALKNGDWVLLDEINLAPRDVLDFLDAKTERYSTLIFGCMNSGDVGKKEYEGINFSKITVSSDLYACDINDLCRLYKQEKHVETLANVKCNKRELVRVLEMLRMGFDANNVFRLVFRDRAPAIANARSKKSVSGVGNMPVIRNIHGYVVTEQLKDVVDSVELAIKGTLPVLLQGETSTGKTSMIRALAAKYGKKLLRINNHEHTEASDYFGSYGALESGAEQKSSPPCIGFREGLLAIAMREGHWVLLDELNLAPSDVLEVLNRILDRKDFSCPVRHIEVLPHPSFRIFATQNMGYSGRKMLSRALRSRFVTLNLSPKDESEMAAILCTFLPKSFVKKIIDVYLGLRLERNFDHLVTLRDLFRWGNRKLETIVDVCNEGLMLLKERLRTDVDRSIIDRVFTRVFGAEVVSNYGKFLTDMFEYIMAGSVPNDCFIFTASFRRLLVLLVNAWNSKEPVLIVGKTGIGKSRMVETAAQLAKRHTVTISMHGSADSADFIGAHSFSSGVRWKDGPLLKAMREGAVLIIDEINLAETSVLERLNSVLEKERELVIPEIGEEIKASEQFLIAACMNPGNDAGKKELSAALRNRFTEIYFSVDEREVKELATMLLETKFNQLLGNDSQKNSETHKILLSEFKREFHESKVLSVRKMELVVEFICKKIFGGFEGIVHGEDKMVPKEIFKEAVSLESFYRDSMLVNDCMLGIHPYYVKKVNAVSFNFRTPTMQKNLFRILRAIGMKRGVMLEGAPGTGKTSIITSIAKVVGKKVLRINLSDQTEFSDLTGTYLPTPMGIEFVKGSVIRYLEEGHWVILDEVNLCSQSVIEGLNSILDYRGSLETTEFSFRLHPESRIFCTLNPANRNNRRKTLPGSFVDRFIKIDVECLGEIDIRMILEEMFSNPIVLPTLREAIKVNMIGRNYYLKENITYICSSNSIAHTSTENICASSSMLNEGKIHLLRMGMASTYLADAEKYVIVHSQMNSLETLMRCYSLRLPVILTGFGALSALEFVSSEPTEEVQLHRESDVSDILGQYIKTGANTFEWEDSRLVASLKRGRTVVLRNPEQVEKCILDRLNSLFENERTLLLHEKGVDIDVCIHPNSFLALLCDDMDLSPALVDRCVLINFSHVLNWIDIQKLFFASKVRACKDSAFRIKDEIGNLGMDEKVQLLSAEIPEIDTLELDLRKFGLLDIRPSYLNKILPNFLDETLIRNMFCFLPMALDSSERAVIDDPSCKEVVDLYKEIEIEFESLTTDEEKVRALYELSKFNGLRRTLMFVKHTNLSFVEKCPRSIKELKIFFIRSFKNRTLRDYKTLHSLCDLLAELREIDLDISFSSRLFHLNTDPRRVFYVHKKEQLVEFYNRESKRLEDILVEFYKYGFSRECGNATSPLAIYNAFMNSVHKMTHEMHRLNTKRDYRRFISDLDSYSFKTDMREFDELLTYYKVHMLLKRKIKFSSCKGSSIPSDVLSLMMMRGEISQLLGDVSLETLGFEFCRAFYQKSMHGKISKELLGKLIFEMLSMPLDIPFTTNVPREIEIHAMDECLSDKELTLTLKSIFPTQMAIRLFNRNEHRIFLTPEYVNKFDISEHIDKTIFSYPEDIITSKRVKKSLYSCVDTVVDYRMFIPLVLFDFSIDLLRKYLLDTNIGEFLHRLSFMESFLCMKNRCTSIEKITKVYNVSLQYKTFDVALQLSQIKEHNRIKKFLLKETCTQLRYVMFPEPSAEKTYTCPLSYSECKEHFQKHYQIFGPVNCGIGLDSYKCLELYAEILRKLANMSTKEGTGLQLLDLAMSLGRKQKLILAVISSFKVPHVVREDIFSLYYARMPRIYYSEEEIGVAKLVYLMTVHELNVSILFLILCAMLCPSIPFAYFLFKLINTVYRENVSDSGIMQSGAREGAEPGISDDDNGGDEVQNEEEVNRSSNTSEDFCSESQYEDDFCEGQNEINVDDCSVHESYENGDMYNDTASFEQLGEDASCKSCASEVDNSLTDESCLEVDGKYSENVLSAEDSYEECSNKIECQENVYSSEEGSICVSKSDELELLQVSTEYIAGMMENNTEQLCEEAENYTSKALDREREGDILAEKEVQEETVLAIRQEQASGRELFCMLRNILEENKKGKYRGDFKSGKKLNMKRIAAFVASGYKRDKIWMKRVRNTKRDYVIRVFIDNSKSMARYELVNRMSIIYSQLESVFNMLEIQLELYRFGRTCVETSLNDLDFKDLETNIDWISNYNTGVNLVLTDGVFQTSVSSQNTLLMLIDKHRIREMRKVVLKDGLLVTKRYLDTLEMRYCVLEDVSCLESHFVSALKELLQCCTYEEMY
eukprot:jgi/Antlo1/2111/2308